MDESNFRRGDRGQFILNTAHGEQLEEHHASDTIADILHWCQRYGFDPWEAVRQGALSYAGDLIEAAWINSDDWPSDELQDPANMDRAIEVLDVAGCPDDGFRELVLQSVGLIPID